MDMGSHSIGMGNLRKVALSYFQDVLLNLHNVKVKLHCQDKPFKSDRELPALSSIDLSNVTSQVIERLKASFDVTSQYFRSFLKISEELKTAKKPSEVFSCLKKVTEEAQNVISELGIEGELFVGTLPVEKTGSYFNLDIIDKSNRVVLHWNPDVLADEFILAVSYMAKKLRDDMRQPSTDEYFAYHVAYFDLSRGKFMDHDGSRVLGTPGFRPDAQTYMSLTDPGDGHVLGTTRFEDWMKGAIVHVEHLERPNHLPREKIESYRIPSIYDFTKVRLHVGSSAPTTYFVGRRVKDSGHFQDDFLKLVNITAASASAAFFQGAAECKVSMEGLSTSQAVRYMQALTAQTQKSRKQFLSAAWNLNQTVLDDIDPACTAQLKERMDIAIRAIEVTSLGGFDKVTWDGASDTYPSKCIMYQLSFEETLTLVHEAHIRGLVTYFSAGFKYDEIKLAVYTGVDGVGIGGAQVLRYMDSETGMHGPYTEENIPRILAERDEAEKSVRGKGVHLLTRLDTMFFEGSISPDQNLLRYELYTALLMKNERRIEELMEQLVDVWDMPDEGHSTWIALAKRLSQSSAPLLKEHCKSIEEWEEFVSYLDDLAYDEDEEAVIEEYENDTWMALRKRYRDWQTNSHKVFTRNTSFTLPYKYYN